MPVEVGRGGTNGDEADVYVDDVSSNPEVAALGLDVVIQQKLPLALILVLLFVCLRTRFRSLAPAP